MRSQLIAAILAASYLVLSTTTAHAQKELLDGSKPAIASDPVDAAYQQRLEMWQSTVWWLAPSILVFASLLFVCIFATMWRSQRNWDEQTFKAFGLTLILSSGLFLIVVGWSDEQLAPMMGLLGTIAGYILGESRGHTAREREGT